MCCLFTPDAQTFVYLLKREILKLELILLFLIDFDISNSPDSIK